MMWRWKSTVRPLRLGSEPVRVKEYSMPHREIKK